jgi:deazaflavin-dependent oxidoreductase (nitroreductase family)
MTHATTQTATQAPAFIRRSGVITSRLLGAGVSLGPNALVTIRGRSSGQLRTTPLAVVEIDRRRWLVGTYGDVQWTKNLRAAGEATLRVGSHEEQVSARELSPEEAAAWFRDVLAPHAARQNAFWRVAGQIILRMFASDIVDDPAAAAAHRPVFELSALTN